MVLFTYNSRHLPVSELIRC